MSRSVSTRRAAVTALACHVSALFALVTSSSCKKEDLGEKYVQGATAVIAELRPAAEAKIAELEAVRKLAAASPAVSPIAAADLPGPTDVVVDFDDQRELDSTATDGSICTAGNTLPGAYRLKEPPAVGKQVFTDGDDVRRRVDGIRKELGTLGRATHALACRQLGGEPIVKGGKSFTGGSFQGECRLFRLGDRKLLGGFAIEARLKDSEFSTSLGNVLAGYLESAVAKALPKTVSGYGGQNEIRFSCAQSSSAAVP